MKVKRSLETELVFEMVRQTMIDKNITDDEICNTVKMKTDRFNKMLDGRIIHDHKFLHALDVLGIDKDIICNAVDKDVNVEWNKVISNLKN